MLGAEVTGPAESRPGHIHRDDPRAEGRADVHGRQADPAAAVHREPLPGPQPGVPGQRPVGGGEPAAQAGGGHGVHRVRQAHQVGVRGVDGHPLGERPGAGEPGLGLVRADLRLARPAVLTPAAAAGERHRDPVAGPPAGHRRASLGDGPGQFVPGNVREADRVVPLPGVPVRPAHPGRADADHHAVIRAGRLGYVSHLRHDPVVPVHDRPHVPPPLCRHPRPAELLSPATQSRYPPGPADAAPAGPALSRRRRGGFP